MPIQPVHPYTIVPPDCLFCKMGRFLWFIHEMQLYDLKIMQRGACCSPLQMQTLQAGQLRILGLGLAVVVFEV